MKLYLKCCNNTHSPIELPNGVPITLGRSKQTKIADKKCSRQQIILTANYEDESVNLNQLGQNSSFVGDEEICRGQNYAMKVDDFLYFFEQNYKHQIVKEGAKAEKRTIHTFFTPKSSTASDEPASKRVKKSLENADPEELSVALKLKALQNTTVTNHSEVSGRNVWIKSTAQQGWHEEDTMYVYHPPDLFDSSKIAAFDMDGTLITTASGRTFAKDGGDWKILYPEIPGKLKSLHREGFKIVIITNQLGIGKGKIVACDFKSKVENILKKFGIPIQVLAITKRGLNRKPNIGSWKWLQEKGNGDVKIDMTKSFYVGDAAGRPKDWAPKKKKDFSCSDRLFALNLGITFKTPEEFFLSKKPVTFQMPEFIPKSILADAPLLPNGEQITSSDQEIIVLVGYPASGKSSFATRYLVSKGYFHVNRDTMKTWQRCVAACSSALEAGKSVVVDNTNPDAESRKRYVECARKRGVKCRCFVMQVSIDHARHNNRFRELSRSGHDLVPDMVFYQYRKAYKEPVLEEGFSEIVKVNFVPRFQSDEMKQNYFLYNA